MVAALERIRRFRSAPVKVGGASLALSVGGAWAAGRVYDVIVRAHPAWALWIPEAPILNRPELQLIVLVPLLLVLVVALIGGIFSRRVFIGKLAVALSVLAILQSAAMAVSDIHDMAVLRNWARVYYAAQREQKLRHVKPGNKFVTLREAQ